MDQNTLRYTETHEWVGLENGVAVVGITQFAADQLTDITYIELPEVGAEATAGQEFGKIETVKAVSDLNSPVTGEVIAINEEVLRDNNVFKEDPYGKGWLNEDPPGTGSHAGSFEDPGGVQEADRSGRTLITRRNRDMSVATQAPEVPLQGTPLPGRQSIVLYGIDWESYKKFLDAVGERRIFLTYDRGKLEIMAPLWNHEWWKRRVGYLLPVLGHELRSRYREADRQLSGGETWNAGLSPMNAFIYSTQSKWRVREKLDLAREPPPDLALEVEMTTECR